MTGYLSRLKARKLKMPLYEVLTKPTKHPFVSYGSAPVGHFEEKKQAIEGVSVVLLKKENVMPEYLWRNPYLQGTPEARAESLRIITAAHAMSNRARGAR